MARDRLVALGLACEIPEVPAPAESSLPPFPEWLSERFPDKSPERRERIRAWKKRVRKA
jgi:hypothetical protein